MANEKYTVIELAEQIGVPRTTISDWIGKYAPYMDFQVLGKRRIYTESTLTVLKAVSDMRNSGLSAADIEKSLSQQFPVHPLLQPERQQDDPLSSREQDAELSESAEHDAAKSESADPADSADGAVKDYSLQISRKSDETAAAVREQFEEILQTVKAIRANTEANSENMANQAQQFSQNCSDISQTVADRFQEISGSLNEIMRKNSAEDANAGQFAVQIKQKSDETAAMVQDRFTMMMDALSEMRELTEQQNTSGIRTAVKWCLAAAAFSAILCTALFFMNMHSSEKASAQSAEWEKKAVILENEMRELKQGYVDNQETFKEAMKSAEDKYIRLREADAKANEEILKAERAVMEREQQELIQSRDVLDASLNEQIEKLQMENLHLKEENTTHALYEKQLKLELERMTAEKLAAEKQEAEKKKNSKPAGIVKPGDVKPQDKKTEDVKPADSKPAEKKFPAPTWRIM